MPGQPFATPVSLDELWKNILFDMGQAVSAGSTPAPLEMKNILRLLDFGTLQTGMAEFGDGSDGVCTFIATGSTTVAGATLSGGTYTLTRDIFLAGGSVINSGVILNTAGFRVFCQGTLTNNGTIQQNGNAAAANVAGAQISYGSAGTIYNGVAGSAGGAGGTTTATAGTAGATAGLGGTGGTGGASTGTVNAGAAGGAVTAVGATVTLPRFSPLALFGRGISATTSLVPIVGGTGGGSGGGDGTNNSGGGGGGAGIVIVVAQVLTGTGTISANGGAGGAASATGTAGGGGGGGGGLVYVISRSVQPVAVNSSGPLVTGQTITATGGAGGAAGGSGGNAGLVGANGTTILLPG